MRIKKTYFLILVTITFSFGLKACSLMQRSEQSGYGQEAQIFQRVQPVSDFYSQRFSEKAVQARQSLGFSPHQSLDAFQRQQVLQRIELQSLERGLRYSAEKNQYYSIKPYFNSDQDRINFLKLPTMQARQAWIESRNIRPGGDVQEPTIQRLIEQGNITLGMSRTAVIQSWGQPDSQEFAGQPIYGNERWIYNKQIATDQGYKSQKRYVYFESGRVVGWEAD